MIKKFKKSQEEMVGFAIIVVIVFVILLIFLSIYLRKPKEVNTQSYEVKSFVSSFLEYTTNCEDSRLGLLPIRELIFYCYDRKKCLNGIESCEILNSTVQGIVNESWKIGANSTYQGYALNISVNGKELLSLAKGNKTRNSRGYGDEFPKRGNSVEVFFTGYF